MQAKSESATQLEPDPHVIQQYTTRSEPWWHGVGYNSVPPAVAGRNASNLSSSEGPNASDSNDDQSMSNSRLNEEDDDATKESHATASSRSACQYLQHASSSMAAVSDECFTQPPQLELVNHSIACATNLYPDPYFGGMMAAYAHQHMGYPHLVGVPHARMALPHEMAQEPVYVNAKQYQGILRRRQARAKAEVAKKLIKVRKPYLHESRHQHAMRRTRGTGGRFTKKPDANPSKHTDEGKIKGSGTVHTSQCGSSSVSDPLPSDSTVTWNSFNGQQGARAPQVHKTFKAHDNVNGNGHYQNHIDLQTSTYRSDSGEKGMMEIVPANNDGTSHQTRNQKSHAIQ